MPAKRAKCPWCRSTNYSLSKLNDYYYITCYKCEAQGPYLKTEKGAIAAWERVCDIVTEEIAARREFDAEVKADE